MGHVIELRRARAVREPAPNVLYRCARCGADLWNLFADGRLRCADCEQECLPCTVRLAGTVHELNPNEQSNTRE